MEHYKDNCETITDIIQILKYGLTFFSLEYFNNIMGWRWPIIILGGQLKYKHFYKFTKTIYN